ncbi:MAG: efflux RND transporter periplasmic adaptor subunit [Steroidobacterales bacterium]
MQTPLPHARGIGQTACAALLAALAGCGSRTPAAPPPPEVVVETVTQRDLPVSLSYPARVSGSRVVEVRARASGIVVQKVYTEGQQVKQGDLLFRIDPAPYQNAYDHATATVESSHADLEEARRQFDRVKTLAASGAVSQRDYDLAAASLAKAQAAVSSADAALRESKLDLGYTTVRAPVAGVASKEAVTVGNTVDGKDGVGGDLLTSIVQANPAYAEFSVPEDEFLKMRELAKVNAGGITAHISSGSTCKTEGKVDFTDTFVNSTTGTVRARAIFPNSDGCLVSGQFLALDIAGLSLPNRIAVPKTAVLFGQMGATAFVVGADNTIAPRPLVIGESWQDGWIVTSGVAPGDRIVVEGIIKVNPGMKVVPLTREEMAARNAKAAASAGPGSSSD